MFFIKIYIKQSYINCYHTSIQMCGQYCILAPKLSYTTVFLFSPHLTRSNWTVTDILFPRHWFLIDLNGIRNCIRKFVLIKTELAQNG